MVRAARVAGSADRLFDLKSEILLLFPIIFHIKPTKLVTYCRKI